MDARVSPDPLFVLLPHGLNAGGTYIRELGRAYAASGCRVVFNSDNLQEQFETPDVVHIHWPEEHYRWGGHGLPAKRAAQFLANLDRLRASGSRVVWTVHNLAPHDFFDSAFDREIYQSLIDRTDVIVHHCEESRRLLGTLYRLPSSIRELVLPFSYQGYPRGIEPDAARLRLDLPRDAFVYLHFGQVRTYKGIDLLLEAFSNVRVPRKVLVVAGRYMAPVGGQPFRERLKYALIRRLSRQIRLHFHDIPDEDVQVYMAAADVLVLAHRAVLNSGVAALGMSFGKVVIGPEIGCVPSMLAAGQNLLYPCGDAAALARSMEQASHVDLDAAGRANIEATARWTWQHNVRQIMNAIGVARVSTAN